MCVDHVDASVECSTSVEYAECCITCVKACAESLQHSVDYTGRMVVGTPANMACSIVWRPARPSWVGWTVWRPTLRLIGQHPSDVLIVHVSRPACAGQGYMAGFKATIDVFPCQAGLAFRGYQGVCIIYHEWHLIHSSTAPSPSRLT